jgi:signal transduction histidine kinase
VFLTAADYNAHLALRGYAAGAVDYLTKPIDAHRVTIRVRGAIERGRLLKELQTLRANFTSMLVHDLRAPLTVIDGYTQLLKHRLGPHADSNLLRYAVGIDESAKRMLSLIRQILDVSKFEVGKLTIEQAPVDVHRLVADVVEAFQPAAKQRGIALAGRGTDVARTVVGDVARLEQVIMNLLTNALKFTAAGGTITIEVAGNDHAVTVAVRDDGPGVPPDERQFLFEPFSQTASGRGATTPGTGLGLVICRRLVEAHQGRIWLEDADVGCCFVFSLPVNGNA